MNTTINLGFAEIVSAIEGLENVPVRIASAEEVMPEDDAFIVVSSAPVDWQAQGMAIAQIKILLSAPALTMPVEDYRDLVEMLYNAMSDKSFADRFQGSVQCLGVFFQDCSEDATDNRWIWEGTLRAGFLKI